MEASYLEIASSTSSFDSAFKINGAVQCLFVNHGSVPLKKNLLFTLHSISTLTSPNHLNHREPTNLNHLAGGPSNLSPRLIPYFDLSFNGLISSSLRFAFNTALITLVAQRCPNLEVLSIRSSLRVTDYSISMIAFGCSNLRELDISYCYLITHESLVVIGKNCPNLEVLKRNRLHPIQLVEVVPARFLNVSPQDGDSEAAAIANSMPHLESLEIKYPKLTVKGLKLICQGCPNLEFLDLSGIVAAKLTSQDIDDASSSLLHLKNIKKPRLNLVF